MISIQLMLAGKLAALNYRNHVQLVTESRSSQHTSAEKDGNQTNVQIGKGTVTKSERPSSVKWQNK